MKKTLQLVLLLLLGYNTQAQTTTSLFPVLNPTDDKDLPVLDFNLKNSKEKEGFLKINPDYFETGKYTFLVIHKNTSFSWGKELDGFKSLTFKNTDYPSTQVNSNNLLDNYNSIQILFSGMIPFYSRHLYGYDKWIFSTSILDFEKDNPKRFTRSNYNEIYNELNNNYKSSVATLLKNKSAKNIFVQDMLVDKLNYFDTQDGNLILQFSLDDILVFGSKRIGENYPSFTKYSLSVINTKGEVVKKYNQAIFFYQYKWNSDHVRGYPNEFVQITIMPAFNSLLNQFLNDTKTNNLLKELASKQQNAISQHAAEVNKLQVDLLNIKLEKTKIISQLTDIGVRMEGITSYSTINASSLYAYNSNYSSELNQQGSSAAVLAGGIVNMIQINAERNRMQSNTLLAVKLKARYGELDEEEKTITAAIPPEILNSPAVLFLPNNAELNQYMQAATQSYNQKSTAASTNLTQQKSKMMSDWKAENDAMNAQIQKSSLTPESAAVTNGANGTSTTPDGNSPEAMQCSKRTKNEWMGRPAYKKFMTTERTQANGYRSQKDLIELTLANCGQYIPQNEQEALRKEILNLNKVISDLENGGGVQRFEAPPASTNNTQQTTTTTTSSLNCKPCIAK